MTIYLTSIRGTITNRFKVQAKTADGTLVGQALDADEAEAERRAIRQAWRWANDRGQEITVRKPAREIR